MDAAASGGATMLQPSFEQLEYFNRGLDGPWATVVADGGVSIFRPERFKLCDWCPSVVGVRPSVHDCAKQRLAPQPIFTKGRA